MLDLVRAMLPGSACVCECMFRSAMWFELLSLQYEYVNVWEKGEKLRKRDPKYLRQSQNSGRILLILCPRKLEYWM
jgi:hypothetical protein